MIAPGPGAAGMWQTWPSAAAAPLQPHISMEHRAAWLLWPDIAGLCCAIAKAPGARGGGHYGTLSRSALGAGALLTPS